MKLVKLILHAKASQVESFKNKLKSTKICKTIFVNSSLFLRVEHFCPTLSHFYKYLIRQNLRLPAAPFYPSHLRCRPAHFPNVRPKEALPVSHFLFSYNSKVSHGLRSHSLFDHSNAQIAL